MNDPNPSDVFYSPPPQTMRLWMSDQQWLSLISRIQHSRTPHGVQRRREPRVPVKLHCIIRITQRGAGSATYTVRTRNISSGGIGFIHDKPMMIGAMCTVALESADQGGRVVCGRVAWCRPIPSAGGPCEVGLQFDQPIDIGPIVSPPAA